MGSAGEIFIKESGVCLYAHGAEDNWMIRIVQNVLKKKKNWEDPAYLAGMFFSEMIKEKEDEYGCGINSRSTDPTILITINCSNQTIEMRRYCGTEKMLKDMGLLAKVEAHPNLYREGRLLQLERAIRSCTFEEFSVIEIENLYKD